MIGGDGTDHKQDNTYTNRSTQSHYGKQDSDNFHDHQADQDIGLPGDQRNDGQNNHGKA